MQCADAPHLYLSFTLILFRKVSRQQIQHSIPIPFWPNSIEHFNHILKLCNYWVEIAVDNCIFGYTNRYNRIVKWLCMRSFVYFVVTIDSPCKWNNCISAHGISNENHSGSSLPIEFEKWRRPKVTKVITWVQPNKSNDLNWNISENVCILCDYHKLYQLWQSHFKHWKKKCNEKKIIYWNEQQIQCQWLFERLQCRRYSISIITIIISSFFYPPIHLGACMLLCRHNFSIFRFTLSSKHLIMMPWKCQAQN